MNKEKIMAILEDSGMEAAEIDEVITKLQELPQEDFKQIIDDKELRTVETDGIIMPENEDIKINSGEGTEEWRSRASEVAKAIRDSIDA